MRVEIGMVRSQDMRLSLDIEFFLSQTSFGPISTNSLIISMVLIALKGAKETINMA